VYLWYSYNKIDISGLD